MLLTRDLYNDYIYSIDSRMALISTKIQQYEETKLYLETALKNNVAEFENAGVNLDVLLAHPIMAYIKIKDLVAGGYLKKVAHYVKSYSNTIAYLNAHTSLYEKLKRAKVTYDVYLQIIEGANEVIANNILKGKVYSFGSAGRVYIREKASPYFNTGLSISRPVDWKMTHEHKKILSERGVSLYSKQYNPNGKKWFIYHDNDFWYWFWWEAGAVQNRRFFKFYPSNYCNHKTNKSRTHLGFLENVKSKEEIFNNPRLGNMQKMVGLLNIDPLHYLNYRRDNNATKKYKHEF